jgi:hypothetical protein
MSYQATLDTEIDKIIGAKMSARQPLLAKWIAHEICERHKSALRKGPKSDFWRHSGYRSCRAAVTKRIGLIAGISPATESPQAALPGFDYLRTYYTVDRDGEDVGLPISMMSDPELDKLAHRLDAMSNTCKAHAREVRRFKAERSAVQAEERVA